MEKRYRSAKTGLYVSEEYAKKHKDTTVAETDKKPKKKK
ncbi:MAG TPA: multidrug transporter [Candidatus Moranbacteria bacterium]|nr:multidrug transporter [Candidatus Moranbacteria bacterium]HRZ33854.1 multidrug transporter [Candidatus Moranbacteria bacterium]